MRKKLREIMDKEEGFTLVELLAVIVILGIILAIAIPSIGGVINKAKEDSIEAEYAMIVDAGRLYLTAEDKKTQVTVNELITKNYIEKRESESFKEGEALLKYVVKKDDTDNIYKLYPEAATDGPVYPKE